MKVKYFYENVIVEVAKPSPNIGSNIEARGLLSSHSAI